MWYVCFIVDVFFFKQKTAYEMRISDWSSDCALPIFLVRNVLKGLGERRFHGTIWSVERNSFAFLEIECVREPANSVAMFKLNLQRLHDDSLAVAALVVEQMIIIGQDRKSVV